MIADIVGVTLAALILEAMKLANNRAQGMDADTGPLFQAIRDFYVAYHRDVGVPETTLAPTRFSAGIQAVEPGVYDLAALAKTMIAACDEVVQEGGFAATDPAVRLLTYQAALVCILAPDRREGAELMFECTRRKLGR